jgi:GTP:adenosylcobinamide-phosphate guanylyltransferase
MGGKFHLVILAAQRAGAMNPLAEQAGVSHKCLIPMAGRPLIAHVAGAAKASGIVDRITVSIEDVAAIRGVAGIEDMIADGTLRVTPSGANLFDSIAAALTEDADYPAIVTTADNVLLTPGMLRHFATGAAAWDAALAVVRKEVLLAAYPDGQRRFHRFRDAEISNCNLYAVMTPKALKAAEAFRGGGQFAKASRRKIAKAIGLFNMLAYKFAWFGLDEAMARLGRRSGIRLGAVEMPFPEAPIDVDNERTMRIAGEILAARAALNPAA